MHQHGGNIYKHKNIIDFSANINMLGTPEGVIQAACEGAALSFHYPDPECTQLRAALSEQEQVPVEQLICGNGAADLIFAAVSAKKPKKALLLAPSFYEYEQALRMVDCEINYYYLNEENGFHLGPDFLDQITEDLDMLFLCNPNNPTGILTKVDRMDQILRKCEAVNCLFMLDECFMDFIEDRKDYTLKDRCETSPNLFLLKAFTKLYAMPGLRLGYGRTCDAGLLKKMKEVSQPWSVSIPAQMAGIAALKETEYVRQSLELVKQEREYLIQEMNALNIKVYDSRANYIFFKSRDGLADACLDKGFLIRDCSNYMGLDKGYYRIAVKTHEDNMKLIEAFKEVL